MKLFQRQRHPSEILAVHLANTIRHQLTRLNYAYREKRADLNLLQEVEFIEPIIATPSEIKLEIDVSRLPRGVSITDLRDAKALENLAAACKFPVRAEQKKGPGGGFWLVVELEERSRMPSLFRFAELRRPDKAPPLLIPIGAGENGKQRWEDLRALPHLLIAGATGQGKSVMVNSILCYLTRRLGPEHLHLYLVDLKGGMELSFYKDLPHVKAFVTRNTETPDLLLKLQNEMERRTQLMQGKARDLDEYNDKRTESDRLPYIVVIIDEIANAMLSRDRVQLDMTDGTSRKSSVKQEVESLLADLAARARATGIHLIISTQRPSVDVVTGLIKANFPCRIAFGTASETDSRVIIDDSGALGLPKGRLLFRRNMDLIELQAALISSDQVRALVDAIASGEAPPEQLPRSKEEIRRDQSGLLLRIAARDFGGRLPVVKLARHPLVLAAAISRTRTESLLAALAQEGVIARGWFRGGVYAIRWPRKRWESQFPDSAPVVRAQYTRDPRPVSDSVPEHTKAVPELSGTGSAAPGSAQVPADTALILQLAEAQRAQGEPVNHSAIARQLGKRRQTSLRLVKQVLQQDAPCNPS